MSTEALAWAFKQLGLPSAVKFTLVALAECAHYKTGKIFPSVQHVAEITGQDRKTIIANIAKLEAAGLIQDTGERCGRTGQIKVYVAALTVPETVQFQKRNSSAFPVKESQKRDTEPSRKPSLSSKGKKRAAAFDLPKWVPLPEWAAFLEMRQAMKRPVTSTAVGLTIRKLERLKGEGYAPADVLNQSVMNGWLGLFEIKTGDEARPRTSTKAPVDEARLKAEFADHLYGISDEREWKLLEAFVSEKGVAAWRSYLRCASFLFEGQNLRVEFREAARADEARKRVHGALQRAASAACGGRVDVEIGVAPQRRAA